MVTESDTLQEEVRVADIFLDEEYGRPLSEKWVATLASEWNRQALGVVYLSLRDDGMYACLDGNHRVAACRQVEGEDATVPARVYIDLTPKQEAGLYLEYNKNRRAPTQGDVFRAELPTGYKPALEIAQVVESLGLIVGVDGQKGEAKIPAISALRYVHRTHGVNGLRKTLLTIRNTMGTGEGTFQADIIKAVAGFYARYAREPQFDESRLYGVLSSTSASALKGQAYAIRTTSPNMNTWSAMGMAILERYNYGLKKNHLPPWQRHVYGEAGLELQQANGRASANRINGPMKEVA